MWSEKTDEYIVFKKYTWLPTLNLNHPPGSYNMSVLPLRVQSSSFFGALFTPSTLIRSCQPQLIEHSAGRRSQKSPRLGVQLSGASVKWENKEPGVYWGRRFSRQCFQFNVRFGKGLMIFEGSFFREVDMRTRMTLKMVRTSGVGSAFDPSPAANGWL